ncbi:hypothetical protein PGLA_26260 [Paenibacillus glacialis]|uniref:Uncharacterized protein n=1 Tax=Paenibacillus glacialis TaxID=494026 RepID=A0A168C2B8_9BACL|nr:hypothetical protein PGLA_26260 [Paenibacillus glacialis]
MGIRLKEVRIRNYRSLQSADGSITFNNERMLYLHAYHAPNLVLWKCYIMITYNNYIMEEYIKCQT